MVRVEVNAHALQDGISKLQSAATLTHSAHPFLLVADICAAGGSISMPGHILFVDDEPSIRVTLPAILEQHGYRVTATATVAEAIQQISSQPFDVLIADLNIGEPGDGFTVVSAMRRIQPNCVNIILTGYPAFENALRAIQEQVDDFLVKPADIRNLVETIEKKLAKPGHLKVRRKQRLVDCLRTQSDAIVGRALKRMKEHPRLAKIAISDQERIDHIRAVIEQIVRHLEQGPQRETERPAALHGRSRKRQGYSLSMLVDDRRAIDAVLYEVVSERLLELDLSSLLGDLARLNDSLDMQLQHSLETFTGEVAA
jgi:CheY-like chemotaxis protein